MWSKSSFTIPAVAAVGFWLLGGTTPALAATINVPGDAATIQGGIDLAVNGDEVVVADGVYTGPGNGDIDFGGKLVTVRSENGPENCIINCEGTELDPHRGFYFHSGETADAVVDGFTITNGFVTAAAPGGSKGGGLLLLNSSPTVTNCVITGNTAFEDRFLGYGGGMYNESSSPTVTNCMFSGNSANFSGGGMRNELSSPKVTNCTFTRNSATSEGGGMVNDDLSSPTVTNCTFTGNTADFGGGMCNFGSSNPTVTNCAFSGNSAMIAGGGMVNDTLSNPTLTNCTFNGNLASDGGGMNNLGSGPTLTNCTFSGNTASGKGGGMNNDDGSPTVINCNFSGNSAQSGGGMYNLVGSPTVINCIFSGNSASFSGGGMRNELSSPTVTNCTFTGNSASSVGGGMRNELNSSPTVTNCSFTGNWAKIEGGGMFNDSAGSSPMVTNCILWGDMPDEILNNDPDSDNPTVSYSDVQGGLPAGAVDGGGNIDVNPQFVDADGSDDIPGTEDDDLHLLSGSPCIDAADNTAVPKGIDTDLDGNPRFIDDPKTKDTGQGDCPIVDMGSYEFQAGTPDCCPWDLDSNGSVGVGDLLLLLGNWGNPYGVGDLLALLANWGPCP